ncbi:aminomethyl-transferring glycine dehydrogenase subunit GcvPA [Oleisolibacter albus]|uniref:aminomethyl-transferring glycine dehydrogenase subunit GcvPA n=1 Tax=Oleisolibacter albus TaxID=2171757 RepID=UPI000DF217C0|nr:aminomethyl-transferring glycine dehydrogenase subunit GcvPA [Oleisolibacter albus]
MRYLPLTEADRRSMLSTIGVDSVDALFRDVPESARLPGPIADLPNHQGELAVERHLSRLAARNVTAGSVPFFLGAGAYKHHVPASVDQMLLRGEFLTSYTPYQPEVSQGTLQYLFEFQTQVALITGMEVANASMYDGATGTAEAVLMATRITRRTKAILSGGLHPHYREVTETTCGVLGMTIDSRSPDPKGKEDLAALIDDQTACVVVQTPSLFGHVSDFTALCDAAHAKGALVVVVVTEVVSLGLLTPPGAMGADIVVCEGQSIGNPLNFGGPYLGLFATREKYVRQMPGRLCGQTLDAEGKRGFVLTLSTREQHIRREKATSNICTNSGLCALAFTIHLSLLGEQGFGTLARINHANAVLLADTLAKVKGVEVLNDGFFNEFTVKLPKKAAKVVEKLADKGILAGVPVSRFYPDIKDLDHLLLVAATETNTPDDMDALVAALEEVL